MNNQSTTNDVRTTDFQLDVSVVLVNYRTPELTRACIESVLMHSDDIRYEIIVVDNHSGDNSVSYLQNLFPDVKFIKNPVNSGFGSGNNLGIRQAKGKYLFLLNTDTLLKNNSLKIFFDFAETMGENLKMGTLGCVMSDAAGNIQRSSDELPTLWSIVRNTVIGYFSRFVLRKRTSFEQQTIQEGIYFCQTGAIIGADMFIPGSVLADIGLFDESIFMYFEEMDLQLRMKRRGYLCYLIRGPEIIHLEGGSSPSFRRYMAYYKSMFYYIWKHYLPRRTNASR
jgi:Predicted glycosyltransferases